MIDTGVGVQLRDLQSGFLLLADAVMDGAAHPPATTHAQCKSKYNSKSQTFSGDAHALAAFSSTTSMHDCPLRDTTASTTLASCFFPTIWLVLTSFSDKRVTF
jgi:hypothetical protein